MAQITERRAKEIAEKDAVQQDTAQKTRDAKVQKRQDHLEDIDDVLDSIDILLEERDVLVNYIQKGGQ